MSLLVMWENLLEQVIKTPLQRRVKVPLEQADVAKYLASAMQDHVQMFAGKLIAPNVYEVQLSIEDADHFSSHQRILVQDLSDYLIDLAARRNITMLGRPEIRLLPDEKMGRGQIKIHTQLVDRYSEPDVRTALFNVATVPEAEMSAWLEMDKCAVALNYPFITIGRSVENDIIVAEKELNSKHAELKRRQRDYVLRDLNSKYGTRVNGELITECILCDGDKISFANTFMTFKMNGGFDAEPMWVL